MENVAVDSITLRARNFGNVWHDPDPAFTALDLRCHMREPRPRFATGATYTNGLGESWFLPLRFHGLHRTDRFIVSGRRGFGLGLIRLPLL